MTYQEQSQAIWSCRSIISDVNASPPCWHGLEYAARILCRGVWPRQNKKKCPRYDTKQHLMLGLQFWRYGKCVKPLYCRSKLYLQVQAILAGPSYPGAVLYVRVSSMGQIDLFKNYSYSIRQCEKRLLKTAFLCILQIPMEFRIHL